MLTPLENGLDRFDGYAFLTKEEHDENASLPTAVILLGNITLFSEEQP